VAKPQSILGQVKGMARDFSLDAMPKGYVWDLVDYVPSQRGAQLEGRGPWSYLTTNSLAGTIWGGVDAVYKAGEKLLVAAGPNLYEQPRMPMPAGGTAAASLVGTLFPSVLHNGKFYFNTVYWADAQGLQAPKSIDWNGSAFTIVQLGGANTPKPKLIDVWKGRLLAAGDPANPNNVYWSPNTGGPGSAWDVQAVVAFPREVTAFGPMANVCICFHDGMTSRIKGGNLPPGTGITKALGMDTTVDTFSNQYGCVDPASVVAWQENLIFANSHGVMLTDGSTIRSLSDQGGIGEVWRHLYALKRTGTQVSCGIYLDMLFCSILTQWDGTTAREDRPFTFVCDLSARTWYRFSNVLGTCMIPSTTGAEQLWFGTDSVSQAAQYANRLARVSPMFTGLTDIDPDTQFAVSASDAVDGNTVPILPRITTSWQTLGPEGQKRVRSVYVSHATQKQTPFPAGNVMSVGYRLTPVILDSFVNVGGLPFSNLYDRKRLPIGRSAYGIQVHLEQILPSHISRLYDIGIEEWPIDRGRVS
jgi:hypothetical protein